MKKVISLFLSVAMLLSIVSVVDFSAFADVKTGKCGENVSYSLDTSTGILTIYGSGKMNNYLVDVTPSYDSPFYDNASIKSVVIESGVTSIGDYAFLGCGNLMSITIPDSVTSIGYYAFERCESLKSVTIGNSVTTIGENAFSNCTSLTSITIPDSVTSIGNDAFYECESLTDVYYSGTKSEWNRFQIEDLTETNIHCSDGTIFNIDTVIIDCLKYQLDSNNTAAVIGYTDAPQSVTIPSTISYANETLSVTSIDQGAFQGCESLTSVTIPDSVTSIGESAFSFCRSLTNITIPDSVTSIGNDAFYYCESLTDIYYAGTKSEWGGFQIEIFEKTNIHCSDGCIFNGGPAIIDGLKYQLDSNNTATVIGYTGTPERVTVPHTISYENETLTVTSIGNNAFQNCTSLICVTIPDSITSIGSCAFDNCTSVTEVYYLGTVSQFKSIGFGINNKCITEGVIYCIDGTIFNVDTVIIDGLKYRLGRNNTATVIGYTGTPQNVTIPSTISYAKVTLTVTGILYNAFYECASLTNITIPDSVTNVGSNAFEKCTSLTSVIIGNGVTSIDYRAFCDCRNLTNVTIGNSVESIGKEAFDNCENLTRVTIPDSVTSIGSSAFCGCTNLTSITIPDSVTSIGNGAFSSCRSLTDFTVDSNNANYSSQDGVLFNKDKTELIQYPVGNKRTSYSIPNSVTSIDYRAFNDCESLTSVTIGNSVTNIGNNAFYTCSELTDVYYYGTQAQWNSISIGLNNEYLTNAKIHFNFVPCDGDKHNSFGEWKVIKNPTCTDDGIEQRICSYDGYAEEKPIPATGHTEKLINEKAATCTSEGYTGDKVCSVCGVELAKGTSIDKISHSYSSYVIAPTCTAEGYTEHVCTFCGDSYKSDFTDIIAHDLEDTIVAPTCTEKGYTRHACKNCDYSVKDTFINALGHTEVIDKAVAPTCTETGLTEGKHCSVCGDVLVEQEEIKALGHTEVVDKAVAPTCTEKGLTEGKHCSVCGDVLVEQQVVKALGHKTELQNAKEATYTEAGYTGDLVCTVCKTVVETGKIIPMLVKPTHPTHPTQPTQPTNPAPVQPTAPANPAQSAGSASQGSEAGATASQAPKSTSIKKAKGAKSAISLKWKKASGVKGYQIQVATDKKFKKNKKTVTIKKQKTTKTTVKKLKAKKKYYVRIRTYKIVNGKKVYSSWSKVKSVKTK